MRQSRQLLPFLQLHQLLAAVVVVVASTAAAAQALDVEAAFKAPSFLSMQLSPDGKYLAAIGLINKNTGLVLIDTESLAAKLLTGKSPGDLFPLAVHWVANDLLAVDSLLATNIVKTSGEHLHAVDGRFFRNVRPDASGHERILVRARSRNIDRVDVRTGEVSLTSYVNLPGTRMGSVFDSDGVLRVVTTRSTAFWSDDTTVTHWYRASSDDSWQKLATFPILEDGWTPMYFMSDGKSLAVASRQGRDTLAYFRYDLGEHRVMEMLAGHPTQDIYAHPGEADDNYEMAITAGMRPSIEWFDPRVAAIQRAVDAAIPDRINVLADRAGDRVLIRSYGDVDPGRWFLLNTKAMTLREVAASKPEIDPDKMRHVQIVSYPSSDGLAIPAYLTLPSDVPGPKPTVILIHGGPTARDKWEWDPAVQVLATRGYVVLQPQFRGSSGFGKRFQEAGYGQWGLAMQDDITEGVQWLINKGIADPDRICIYGASYGGYAAAWALVKTPKLFRCGITLAGVSDIATMLSDDSDRNDNAVARLWWRHILGDPKSYAQQFDDVSPLKKAALIEAPILIAHGNHDERVPIEHSRKLVKALADNHKQYEWLELDREGHSFSRAGFIRFYLALLVFLDKYIGPASVPNESAKPVPARAEISKTPAQ